MEFPSYPKVYSLGHAALDDLMDGIVVVQEKVDGSQINWRWDSDGGLHAKSKGGWQLGGPQGREKPDDMFAPALDHLRTVDALHPDLIYRGETLRSPRHNTLVYNRVPLGHVALFDVTTEGWHTPHGVDTAAKAMGIDAVPEFYVGPGDLFDLGELLDVESFLGGPKVEGVVIKNFDRFDLDGKPLMGKVVREEFRELHSRQWKADNPTRADVVQRLIEQLNTEARFEKAVQHLRDAGELVNAPQDIGKLMVEVKRDVLDEERAWIVDKLADHFMPQIARGIGRGLPEWYKQKVGA